MPDNTTVKTKGISPKVLVPAIGQIIVGIVFLIIGLDVEGKTTIATGVATFLAGYNSPAAPTYTVSKK